MKTNKIVKISETSIFKVMHVMVLLLIYNTILIGQTRDELIQPEKVMDVIGVTSGMKIGEIGAGEGYFTIKLAKRIGNSGHVYANDIREDALKQILMTCNIEKITNVTTLLGIVDDPMFPAKTMDMVFMSYVFHMLEKPKELLVNILPALRKGATLVILDIEPDRMLRGPYPENSRINEIVISAGYEPIKKIDWVDGVDINIFKPKQ